jgi:hypothetical protein
MKRNKQGFLAIIMLVAVASLFTACEATGVGGASPGENSKDGALKAISAFSITSPVKADGVIDETDHTIAVNVPFGTEIDSMTVLISFTGASVNPVSGTTGINFTTPQTFTVKAADGSEQAYIVTATVPSFRTLVLDPHGGTWKPASGFSGTPVITLNEGEGYLLPAEPDKITKNESSLVSWNTADNYSGTDYTQGQYFVPTGDTVLYARWAAGSEWVDKAGAQDAINLATDAIQAAAGAGGGGTVIMVGDPSQGAAPQPVLDQIDYLMGLLEGHPVNVGISGVNGNETITITLYNVPAIQQATAALETIVANTTITGNVIVPKWTVAYTGDVQYVKLATTGTYEIELEGASGGHTNTLDSTNNTAVGGKGGRVLGRYHFNGTPQSPVPLDIRVGGQGEGTAKYNSSTGAFVSGSALNFARAGGYNGGGGGGGGSGLTLAGSGGGGATDVRPHDNSDPLTGVVGDPRIIVAGGGGGSAQTPNSWAPAGSGYGDAGGLEGKTGYGQRTGIPEYIYPAGGSQSSGNAGGVGQTGSNGTGSTSEGSGGGGGGWWGGMAFVASNENYAGASGGGGSGYNGGTTAYPEGGGATPVLTTPYDPSGPAYVHGSAANNATIAGPVYGNGKAAIRWISPGN